MKLKKRLKIGDIAITKADRYSSVHPGDFVKITRIFNYSGYSSYSARIYEAQCIEKYNFSLKLNHNDREIISAKFKRGII